MQNPKNNWISTTWSSRLIWPACQAAPGNGQLKIQTGIKKGLLNSKNERKIRNRSPALIIVVRQNSHWDIYICIWMPLGIQLRIFIYYGHSGVDHSLLWFAFRYWRSRTCRFFCDIFLRAIMYAHNISKWAANRVKSFIW